MFRILISTVILVHKDIAGTLATEAAEDSAQVAKLRSALESVDHKRRKVCIIARGGLTSQILKFRTLFTTARG